MRDGLDGVDGLSAYEVARLSGFRGSPADWVRSLRGNDGERGPMGKEGPQGLRGLRGEPGPAGERGPAGLIGKAGVDGRNGWTPILAVVADGERRVHQVVRWTGGTGPEPESGWYIGPTGPVARISDATDLRGPKGDGGERAILAGGIVQVYSEDYDPTVSYVALNFRPESEGVYTLRLNIP